MERRYTLDDAVVAAEALREISAGHEKAAAAILDAAGLGGLSNDELEDLCRQFGVDALAAHRSGKWGVASHFSGPRCRTSRTNASSGTP